MELGHFNAGQLADYFSGLWTPDQQREIEIHLSRCDACAMLARQVYVGAFVVENWTAKATAEVAKAKEAKAKEAKANAAAANATRSAGAH